MSDSSFSHIVFKRLLLKTCNKGLFGKKLRMVYKYRPSGCIAHVISAENARLNCKQKYAPLYCQGSPQWIQIDFERLVTVEEIHLQFQGGFAGRECLIEGKKEPTENYTRIQEFYPDDVNSIQISFLWHSLY